MGHLSILMWIYNVSTLKLKYLHQFRVIHILQCLAKKYVFKIFGKLKSFKNPSGTRTHDLKIWSEPSNPLHYTVSFLFRERNCL